MPPAEEIETVDAELVTGATGAQIEPRRALPPAAVAAGVAVGGVAAGMATVTLVKRRHARKAAKRRRRALGKVVASRSFLLDVHVLDR